MLLSQRPMIRTVTTTRYVTPLREGGSLPAIVEADDDGTYVLKFRGAGHGSKSLIAELVAGEIGRALGLPMPEIVLMELDPDLARTERDPEIQDLLRASGGLNLALDFLPGAFEFDVLDRARLAPLLASAIVWFDAYITNVDRTARNPNMLFWRQALWLIDHGSSLYFHHTWNDYLQQSRSPFRPIKDHVLLPVASAVPEADINLRARLTPELLANIVALIPEAWLEDTHSGFDSPAGTRDAYLSYLLSRLAAANIFVEEALHARAQFV